MCSYAIRNLYKVTENFHLVLLPLRYTCRLYSHHAQSLSQACLFAIPWIIACQALLSMEFSSQEYWSGLPFPTPDLSHPGIEPLLPAFPTLVFPCGSDGFSCGSDCGLQCERPGFDGWAGKVPWRRAWQPTPVFLPGESPSTRNLKDYSPWGREEADTIERQVDSLPLNHLGNPLAHKTKLWEPNICFRRQRSVGGF